MSPLRRTSNSRLRLRVSVLTPSVPERADMLAECVASVDAQTFRGWEHLVLVDEGYEGCARTVNRLAADAKADWLFLIADDDLLLPDCLAAHLSVTGGADIVYSPPVVEGEPEGPFHGDPPGIPAVALIRRSLWDELGGYDVEKSQCEDYDFYERALAAGASFHRLRESMWVYRFHGANKSRGAKFG